MSFFGKILIELVGQTILAVLCSLLFIFLLGLEIKWAVPMSLIIVSINNGVSEIGKLTKK